MARAALLGFVLVVCACTLPLCAATATSVSKKNATSASPAGGASVPAASSGDSRASAPDASTAARTSYATDVSPRRLKKLVNDNTDALLFLALYMPHLPKWRLHFQPVLEAVAEHYKDDDRVMVLKANCGDYPSFTKQYAARAFPDLHFYLPNLETPVPFRVKYETNATAESMVGTIDRQLLLTANPVDGIHDIHRQVMRFVTDQAALDHGVMVTTGAGRRAQLARVERLWRATMVGEETPVSKEETQSMELLEKEYGFQPEGSDGDASRPGPDDDSGGTAVLNHDATDKDQQVELEVSSETDVPRAPPAPKKPTTLKAAQVAEQAAAEAAAAMVNLEAEAATLAPLVAAVEDVLQATEVRIKRLNFYLEVLKDVQEHGSGTVARQLNTLTTLLYRKSEALTEAQREALLLRISILREFAEGLF